MKKLMRSCAVLACALAIAGCSMDSLQLGEYVRKEMQEEFVKKDGFKALQMKEVRLIKQGENLYMGIGKGEIDGTPIKFDVKCQYDGKTVLWDASLSDDNAFSLAAKEKAKEVYDKIKAAWPGVKAELKQRYDEAAKKAGEYYDAATKKASEAADDFKREVDKHLQERPAQSTQPAPPTTQPATQPTQTRD